MNKELEKEIKRIKKELVNINFQPLFKEAKRIKKELKNSKYE